MKANIFGRSLQKRLCPREFRYMKSAAMSLTPEKLRQVAKSELKILQTETTVQNLQNVVVSL